MYPNIDAELARNRITKYKLAEMLQVDRKTIANWFSKGKIPADKLAEMAKIFNVTTDYLLGRQ